MFLYIHIHNIIYIYYVYDNIMIILRKDIYTQIDSDIAIFFHWKADEVDQRGPNMRQMNPHCSMCDLCSVFLYVINVICK